MLCGAAIFTGRHDCASMWLSLALDETATLGCNEISGFWILHHASPAQCAHLTSFHPLCNQHVTQYLNTAHFSLRHHLLFSLPCSSFHLIFYPSASPILFCALFRHSRLSWPNTALDHSAFSSSRGTSPVTVASRFPACPRTISR